MILKKFKRLFIINISPIERQFPKQKLTENKYSTNQKIF